MPISAFAQLKVIISAGFSEPYRELIPQFEKTSKIMVVTTSGGSQGTGPNTIEAQLDRGVSADVVILNKAGLTDLLAHGKVIPGTEVDLAETPLALAVRSGAPKPNIGTVEEFKKTLLGARSVTFTSSTTGIYLTTKLFPRLGIAEELSKKSTTAGVTAVAKGDVEMAIQALSELLPVSGIEVVGNLPSEVQNVAVFSAAVVKGSKDATASKQLIAFLSSPAATAAILKSGMELPKRR